MLGTGLRTNQAGAQQLLDADCFGTERVVIVEDVADLDIQRMHLDTFFNLCDERLCVCLGDVADDKDRYLRMAREYRRVEDEGEDENGRRKGRYREILRMPFGKWLKKEKFEVVKASHEQQDAYFLNFLHLGKNAKGENTILATNRDVEKAIKEAGFVGHVETIDFTGISTMYGGVHCSSQVLRGGLTT
jgi:N-dimethylarginine dimethylaminohydrolase